MVWSFRPRSVLTESDTRRALTMLLIDGTAGQVLMVLTTGAFLIGFALQLGASNTVIGVLSAIGPLSQILQLPSILLVEQVRLRKMITFGAVIVCRAVWVLIAFIPWYLPKSLWIPAFLVALLVHFGTGAIAGCAFNSWIKDLVPDSILVPFFTKRLTVATAAGALLSLAAGIGIDLYGHYVGAALEAYSILFIVASVTGLLGAISLARIPEPEMPRDEGMSIGAMLAQPFRDPNFRQLLIFLGFWSFAVNFSGPFFGVYLLRELGMSMTSVLILSVISQFVNVAFFSIWGRLADRFSNKSVIAVSGPLFIFSFILWPFTTMPEPHMFTIPLLVAIHVLAGMSTAGVTLCAGNIALKSAPYGRATAYMAMTALVSGLAATIAPIMAGFAADFFNPFELKVTLNLLRWIENRSELALTTIDFRGLDFIFLIGFVLGMMAMHRLLAVREEGEVREAIVRQELLGEMRRVVRQVSTAAGMRQLTSFPYSMLKSLGGKKD